MSEAEFDGPNTEDIDAMGLAELDDETALKLSDDISRQITEEFGHCMRVVREQEGDDVSASMHMDSSLDAELFVGELKGMAEVEVMMEYSLAGTLDQTLPQITVGWKRASGRGAVVTAKQGDAPIIQTYITSPDGKEDVDKIGGLSVSEAFELSGVMKAVHMAAFQQQTYAESEGTGTPSLHERSHGRSLD